MATKYSGFEWLLIDAASMYGLDKELFEDRLAWGVSNLDKYKVNTVAELKENLADLIAEADEPNMFAANAIAIFDAIHGKSSGYPVGVDAAASGPALLSILGRCVTGMMATGCIDTGLVPDLYTRVQEKLGTGYSRTKVKSAIVPHVYASTRAPKQVFGDAYPKFLKAYTSTAPMAQWASDTLVNGWNSNALVHEWDLPDGAVAHVKVVVQAKTKGTIGKGRTYTYIHNINGGLKKGEHGTKALSPNVTHSYDGFVLRELNRRCNYDPVEVQDALCNINYVLKGGGALGTSSQASCEGLMRMEELARKFNFISMRALEYMTVDALAMVSRDYVKQLQTKLFEMLEYPTFEMENIHDEFRCLPNHVNRMKDIYNDILAESYESDWLVQTLLNLTGVDYSMAISPIDAMVSDKIRSSTYSLN